MIGVGPINPGTYRTIVLESNGSTTWHDFPTLDAAIRHADDAASEDDDAPPLAYVYDSDSNLVYKGKHYAT